MHHARSLYQLHTRVFTDSHHTMRCPYVIKTVIDGLHPMIIFKTKVMFYKPKLFGCHFSNGHFIYKIIMSFVGSGFLESHRRLHFIFGLSLSEFSKPVRVFHPRECLALLAITRHKFSVLCNCAILLDFLQRYRAHPLNHQLWYLILTMHPHP